MGILNVLFGNSDETDDSITVVDNATGWTGTYPGPLTDEIAEILGENGYAVVEDENDEEEDRPWWKIW